MMSRRSMRSGALAGLLAIALAACVSDRPKQEPWDRPERATVQTDLAWNYLRRDELEVAREHVEAALALDANDSRANHVKALLLLRLGERDAARSYFKRALRSDPDNNDARNDYGAYLCDREEYKQGIAELERALASALNRRVSVSSVYLGDCYLKQQQLEDAGRYYRQALEENPGLARPLIAMAVISFEEANYLSARAYLERYFAVGPETAQTLLYAVKVEQQLGATDLAIDYARKLRAQYPRSSEADEATLLVPDSAR